MELYLVEGYGGEYESRFIPVVAEDTVDAERKARKWLDHKFYPHLDTECLSEVDGYKIIPEKM